MHWFRSNRNDPLARRLADRHYSRQKVGAPGFVPPGRCLVLRTDSPCDAYWVTSWPFAEYVRHEWAGAWVCSAFRSERSNEESSSELIVQAVAATRWRWLVPPPEGMITFVDPSKVPGFFRRTPGGRVLEWGYSFQKAGFTYAGWTKSGLFALRLSPEDMPEPAPPATYELSLFGEHV